MQSIIGLLKFACSVVDQGRTFLRRLINLTFGLTNPKSYIRLNKESRADLETWAMFIGHYNGRSVFVDSAWLSSDHLSLYTDASGSLGAVLGSQYQVCIIDMFPIVLALEVWSVHFINKNVFFLSDSMAVVEVINKKSCRDKSLMKLLRRLVVASLTNYLVF